MDGTWGDHIILQAIAETVNLRIHVIESSQNFAELTLVQTLNLSETTRSIYIGHIEELHYVSTRGLLSEITSAEVVKRKLFENSSEATNACKRKCTNLRESQIKSSSRVETHSHSNALSTYNDANTDDSVKTTYHAKRNADKELSLLQKRRQIVTSTKKAIEKKCHLTKRHNKINTKKTTGQK